MSRLDRDPTSVIANLMLKSSWGILLVGGSGHGRTASLQLFPNQLDTPPPEAASFMGIEIRRAPRHSEVAGKYINKNFIKITGVLTLFILHAKIISTNSLTRGYEWQNLRSVISIES